MFNIGDTVYYAAFGSVKKQIPCPVCFTKKEVTLILGNGDEVILPCSYCQHSFLDPSGYVSEYERTSEPLLITITGRSITQDGSGVEKVEYHSGCDNAYSVYHAEKCFSDKEEARKYGELLADEGEVEEQRRKNWFKQDRDKSYSWNVGYYKRDIKDAKERIEYAEAKMRLCQAKAKTI